MEYLIKEDFILINKATIDRHGGNYSPPLNLLNAGSLDFVLEAVKGEIFGKEVYPNIYDKAAAYMFLIIDNHIFLDGNKRTGLEAALLFLRLNEYRLKDKLSTVVFNDKTIPHGERVVGPLLFQFTMELASGEIDLDSCREWFSANIEPIS